MNPYIVLGTAGAILAAGVWGGYQMAGARYIVGFQAGVASQQKISDAEMARLIAESRASTARALQEAAQAHAEQERVRHESEARQRAVQAQEAADTAAALRDLRRRLRVATASRDAGGSGAMSAALPSPPGPVNDPDTARLLRDAAGKLVDLTEAAEREAGRYRSCYRWAMTR